MNAPEAECRNCHGTIVQDDFGWETVEGGYECPDTGGSHKPEDES